MRIENLKHVLLNNGRPFLARRSGLIVEGRKKVGLFKGRPNRFTVLIKTEKGVRRCHLRDPGRLRELLKPDVKVMFIEVEGKRRKTDCEVIAVHDGTIWTVVNSGLHTSLAIELLSAGVIPEIKAEHGIRPEVKYGDSRIDLQVLGSPPTLVEVKGCTLVVGGTALFPDAPTNRGLRHLKTLIRAVEDGLKAYVLFLVMRPDAKIFMPNWATDPEFSRGLVEAFDKGVGIIAYTFTFNGLEIKPVRRIPVTLLPLNKD